MRKVLVSSMIGNSMEWFDYAIYGQFAPLISRLFFPKVDETAALLAVFGIYFLGFVMRPVGAVFFGYIGDRYGRRASLSASVLMMAIPTSCIGILPTYEVIGVMAPVILTIIRLLQGMSMGGEFGGSMAFLVEHSPSDKRGLMGSASVASLGIGVMLGAAFGAAIGFILPLDQFESWGWRIPFLFSIVFGGVGFYIRSHTTESTVYKESVAAGAISKMPLRDLFKDYKALMMQGILLSMTVCVPFHSLVVYMNTFTTTILGRGGIENALLISMISMISLSIFSVLSAHVSDKIGRRPVLFAGAFGLFLWAYPTFYLLEHYYFWGQLIAQFVFATLLGIFFGPVPAALVEMFPTKVRYTGLSFSYNMSITIFGGSLPYLAVSLIKWTGLNGSVAFYIMFANLCTMLTIWFMKETYRSDIS